MKRSSFPAFSVAALSLLASHAYGAPTPTKLVAQNGTFRLERGGQPYFIKGVGGSGSKPLLKTLGGNSFRTWGADNLDAELDEAQKLGLSVTVGIWLGHKEQGFNYNDAGAVAAQLASAKAAILRYKDHPAVLMWGIGNEMEGYEAKTDPKMWAAVQEIAAFAHQVDKNHPTMTVVAEIGGDKVPSLNQYCPDIDVLGINSYGGGASIATRYKAAGGTKPYVMTEYGPPGTWESRKNEWGAVPEPTSTEKTAFYRATYEGAILNQPLSLGGYAFTWGNKQEATATWFGLLLPDGTKLGAADELSTLWNGKPPADTAPQIKSLKLTSPPRVQPGAEINATLDATDPEGKPLRVQWVLQADPMVQGVGGAHEAVPPTYPDAILKSDARGAQLKAPAYGGGYRLFAYVYDGAQNAAVGNLPVFVEGGGKAPLIAATKAKLPLALVAEGDNPSFVPSGYMGNAGAIKMDPNCATKPHSGATCLKVVYTAGDSWGGVVWQSPANDWGDQPGGYDLTGAKTLSFWARGEQGGEQVNFSYGILGKDKPYHDSGSGKLEGTALTTEWKQYTIDLQGQDLTRIKTGFVWSLAAKGQGVTFYLDDVKFE